VEQQGQGQGASASAETGSHASHEAPLGLRPSGFDPARIRQLAEKIDRVGISTADAFVRGAYTGRPERHTLEVTFYCLSVADALRARAVELAEQSA
jgi:hypothetical protein